MSDRLKQSSRGLTAGEAGKLAMPSGSLWKANTIIVVATNSRGAPESFRTPRQR